MLLEMKKSGANPLALQNMPEPHKRLRYYLDNYYVLIRDRRYEQGSPLPITNGQIKNYHSMFGLDDFVEFHHRIVMIDKAYLEVQTAKAEAKRKADEAKAKRSSVGPKKR